MPDADNAKERRSFKKGAMYARENLMDIAVESQEKFVEELARERKALARERKAELRKRCARNGACSELPDAKGRCKSCRAQYWRADKRAR